MVNILSLVIDLFSEPYRVDNIVKILISSTDTTDNNFPQLYDAKVGDDLKLEIRRDIDRLKSEHAVAVIMMLFTPSGPRARRQQRMTYVVYAPMATQGWPLWWLKWPSGRYVDPTEQKEQRQRRQIQF